MATDHHSLPGGWLVRQGYSGQPADDSGQAIASDEAGNVYVTGSVWFEGDSGARPGPADLFVAKYSPTGDVLWWHQLGSPDGDDRGTAIAVGPAGDVYVAGQFQGNVDFDPGPETAIRASVDGTIDAFLLKLTTRGEFVWVKTYGQGSARWDLATAVTVDASEQVTLAGMYGGPLDLGAGGGPLNHMSNSPHGLDLFILRLASNGDLQWAKRLGSAGRDSVMRLAHDPAGNVYLSGTFQESLGFDLDDPGNVNARRTVIGGGSDAFLLKLRHDGGFAWVRQAGGDGFHYLAGLAVGNDGVYAVGAFQNEIRFDHPTTDPSDMAGLTSHSEFDGLIAKLDSDSGALIWLRQASGLGDVRARCVALTAEGGVHVVGHFSGKLTLGESQTAPSLVSAGRTDGFVWQLTSQGETLRGHRLGGRGNDSLRAVCVAADGSLLFTGHFEGRADFPIPESSGSGRVVAIEPPWSHPAARGKDIFVLKWETP